MNYDFILTTRYDKKAYQALADASWQLFRKPQMMTRTYPLMITLSLMVIVLVLWNRKETGPALVVGGLAFAAFVLLAIPLSGVSARSKMCRTAIREVQKRGDFPVDIRFVFGKDTIHSTTMSPSGDKTDVVRYKQLSGMAALGDWRFLFFGPAAYIFHRSNFSSAEELTRFEDYITEKCQIPIDLLKGKGPVR